ncbi:hypothetical protein [Yokenella regensburgei]|uniref:hypothetical protein n=1 Tax=Yokenella regensburgei TaxID=158877 RepID=UPI0014329A85|nr:hypothetical protein [Yokenella regensburgei]QIU88246.1 hypothetical protein HEC60_02100 [Yokenella regensburgei]
MSKLTYEELEAKCASQATKLEMINDLMAIIGQSIDIAEGGFKKIEARFIALTAENTALKSVVADIHSELYGHGFEIAGWHLNGDFQPLDSWFEENNWDPETPATDASLAEVRAQAIDNISNLLMDAQTATNEVSGMAKAIGICEEFAAQLRQEAK